MCHVQRVLSHQKQVITMPASDPKAAHSCCQSCLHCTCPVTRDRVVTGTAAQHTVGHTVQYSSEAQSRILSAITLIMCTTSHVLYMTTNSYTDEYQSAVFQAHLPI